jgi:hypothetical protein
VPIPPAPAVIPSRLAAFDGVWLGYPSMDQVFFPSFSSMFVHAGHAVKPDPRYELRLVGSASPAVYSDFDWVQDGVYLFAWINRLTSDTRPDLQMFHHLVVPVFMDWDPHDVVSVLEYPSETAANANLTALLFNTPTADFQVFLLNCSDVAV